MTVLMAIHDLTMAAQMADRMALLKSGRVLVEGKSQDVLTAQNVESAFGVRAIVGHHAQLASTYVLPILTGERKMLTGPS